MNTTRYIDRLNGSSTHFLNKQLFSVSFCRRPSSNRTIQRLFGSVEILLATYQQPVRKLASLTHTKGKDSTVLFYRKNPPILRNTEIFKL